MNENKKTDREKLMELIGEFFYGKTDSGFVIYFTESECEIIADYLLSHGVTFEKQGEWIDKPTGAYGRWQSWCSACGKHSGIGGIESNRHKPYCPNCGARMKGAKNA